MMHQFGFFQDLTDEEFVATIGTLRSIEPRADEEKAMRYLQRGVRKAVSMCVDEDRLVKPPRLIGAPDILTDGTWAWPATLPYYLREYHIQLPETFVAHMKRNAWECPQTVDIEFLPLEGQDVIG